MGEHDDLVDSAFLGIDRFRSGSFVKLPNDFEEEEQLLRKYKAKGYYWE